MHLLRLSLHLLRLWQIILRPRIKSGEGGIYEMLESVLLSVAQSACRGFGTVIRRLFFTPHSRCLQRVIHILLDVIDTCIMNTILLLRREREHLG